MAHTSVILDNACHKFFMVSPDPEFKTPWSFFKFGCLIRLPMCQDDAALRIA